MKKTVYQYISDMNTAFGNPKGLALENGKIKEAKFSKLLNQAKNIYGEIDELREDGFDVLLKDPESKSGRKELFDALGDILVFLHGVGHFLDQEPKVHFGDRFEQLPAYYLVGDENSEIERLVFGTQDFATRYYQHIRNHTDHLMSAIYDRDIPQISYYFNQIHADVAWLFNVVQKPDYTVEELIKRVTESNMSKLCKTQEEADATLKFYRDLDLVVHQGVSPMLQENGDNYLVVYSSITQKDKNGKAYQEGKFLKNTTWFEPELSDF